VPASESRQQLLNHPTKHEESKSRKYENVMNCRKDDAIWVKPVLQLTQWQILVSCSLSSSLLTLSALYFSPGLFFSDPSTHIQLGPLSDFHFPACPLTFALNCMIYVLVALLGPRVRASGGSHQSFSWYVPMILFFGMIHELLFTV
jgi:hypothetical protein